MRRVRERARRRFVLTPLVDVIFLLVIFFALSSRIAPFGLIAVSGQGRAAVGGKGAETAARAVAPADVTLVVSRGRARAGARVFSLDQLRSEAVRMRAAGTRSVLLLTARSARTEDVATALDALRRAGVANVRLISAPADAAGTNGGTAPQ